MTKSIVIFFVLISGCNSVKTAYMQENSSLQVVTTTPQQSFDEQKKEFQNILSVSAKSSDGTPAFINLCKSVDGTSVSLRIEERKNTDDAKKELTKKMKRAVEILEKKPKLNKDNKQIGERIILNSRQENSDDIKTAIIWTEGSKIRSIEASSLESSLEFEKWYLNSL